MRKFLLAVCTAPVLFLASCTPDVAEIQRITQQVCGFVPTAVTIASYFPNPYTVPAGMIADAICSGSAQADQITRDLQVVERVVWHDAQQYGLGGGNEVQSGDEPHHRGGSHRQCKASRPKMTCRSSRVHSDVRTRPHDIDRSRPSA